MLITQKNDAANKHYKATGIHNRKVTFTTNQVVGMGVLAITFIASAFFAVAKIWNLL